MVDPAEYKNYILVFLFHKYISDIWQEKKEKFVEQYNGNQERVKRALSKERFIIPEGCTYYDIYNDRNDNQVGELINKALDEIEEKNKGKLDGVFRNIDFNSEASLGQTKDRNRRLRNLIEDFAKPELDFRPSHVGKNDVIGDAYEYLISNFASSAGKKGGEFYTPAEVSELLARLLDPQPGQRICDPACGSGSLLIKVAEEVNSEDFSLYGQESNGSTWALAKMNMFLHEKDNTRIDWGDTINNPRLVEDDHLMKFDVVVANPPFSLDKWGAEDAEHDPYNRFWRGVPPKSKADFAFITHMIETTVKDTGKVGVVVPHGVLFRGSKEGKIRQKLIEENLLEAVIGLPEKLFFGTGIPAAILVFNRAKQTDDVLFIDASNQYQEGTRQNRLREEDVQKVADTYLQFRDNPGKTEEEGKVIEDKYAYQATLEEIKENEYNLNIPRYVDTFEEEEPVDIAETQKEIEQLEEQLAETRKEMDKYLKELGYK